MIWIIKEDNYIVTEYYLDVIKESIMFMNQEIKVVDLISLKKCDYKKDIIIVANILKAFNLIIRGFEKVIVWFQGLIPEESFMRNNNIFRKKVLELIEAYVLKKTILAIFVSNEMKKHYERKYKIEFHSNVYLMPCFNTEIIRESFFKKGKYENNTFVYVGSLSPWQGFDEVLKCYQKIELLGIPNSKLLILTPNQKEALQKMKDSRISSYEIGFVQPSELPDILSNAKFGFIIREDVVVNQVSTPTKISTYLANGVIPIYTSSLRDFKNQANKIKYQLLYDNNDFFSYLKNLVYKYIDPNEIYKDYLQLFNKYYNRKYHISNLEKLLKEIL
ncbi:hypothetical protein SDC9_59937 [bioreactor metagenome]|uniref:Glycosyl transferase family 1 domain-containing protein n=1 Tax=bioreactor metagenome TaxID=1076179 RepID=A0A644XBJ6_9ZZZZ|nr:hypothetical protein [Candidatus Metalachnospira sp.]